MFASKLRRAAGPLTFRATPNGLGFHRLGVSVSKNVGNAVARHRWKRVVREAFRLNRHAWPGGLDVVVVVQPSRKAARGVTSNDAARWLNEAIPRLAAAAGARHESADRGRKAAETSMVRGEAPPDSSDRSRGPTGAA